MEDQVNHPSHYTSHPSGIECIDVVEHMEFLIGNAMKYLWRVGLKSNPGESETDASIRDLNKAIWYIQRKIDKLQESYAESKKDDSSSFILKEEGFEQAFPEFQSVSEIGFKVDGKSGDKAQTAHGLLSDL